MAGSIKIEGDDAVIRIPLSEIHGLRVALNTPMRGEVSSNSTQEVRRSFDRALALIEEKAKGA